MGRQHLCNELNYSEELISQILSFDSIKSSIYRWKSEVIDSGLITNLENFDFDFFIFNSGTNFLLHAEFTEDLLIILGDYSYISKFIHEEQFLLVMDGTFKSSSTSFYQVYIIHGSLQGQSFPLLYCSMNDKTERLYKKTFSIIKNYFENRNCFFNPTKIQIDFEVAAFNAVEFVWPNTFIVGCYFHFGQSIWRRIQNTGLCRKFNEDQTFSTFVELCSSLLLVQIEDVFSAWNYNKRTYSLQNVETDSFLSFVESVWIFC
jgi:hypothetical protein